jgi:large conductance mechanosensitive channel
MGIVQEFKEFAVKGNAMDMAVGIIIGAAFNKVVTSLVNDVIMPPIGMMMGGVDFKDQRIVMREPVLGPDGVVVTEEVALRYGMFINTMIDFLIVAFTVFLMVKFLNRLIRRREAVAAAAP